jgi:hypothetical protein
MSSVRQKVIVAAKSHGCMLLDDGDWLRLDAPIGQVFAINGLHYMDVIYDGNKEEGWKEFLEILSFGSVMETCTNTDCDCCVHEPRTFDEIHELYRGERLA